MNHSHQTYLIRIILVLALLMCWADPPKASAEDIKLQWDDDNLVHPDWPVTFRLEMANDNAGPRLWVTKGANLTAKEFTVEALPPGKYLFRVFATIADLDSLPSDELPVGVRPSRPTMPRVKVAFQSSTDLKEWVTLSSLEADADVTRYYRTSVALLAP